MDDVGIWAWLSEPCSDQRHRTLRREGGRITDQLTWCSRIRNGISLAAPNETLASAYLKKAEEALETMQTITAHDRRTTTAYCAMYISLYAVLTRRCNLKLPSTRNKSGAMKVSVFQYPLAVHSMAPGCSFPGWNIRLWIPVPP